jgi:integrase
VGGFICDLFRRLPWGNVDFDKRCLQWDKDKKASGDYRVVPLPGRALESLRLWAENFPDRKPEHYVFPSEREKPFSGESYKLLI